MYQVSDFTKNMYRVHEVAEILGVTTKTIRNYDKDGKLKTCRTEGNHRMITSFYKFEQTVLTNTLFYVIINIQ